MEALSQISLRQTRSPAISDIPVLPVPLPPISSKPVDTRHNAALTPTLLFITGPTPYSLVTVAVTSELHPHCFELDDLYAINLRKHQRSPTPRMLIKFGHVMGAGSQSLKSPEGYRHDQVRMLSRSMTYRTAFEDHRIGDYRALELHASAACVLPEASKRSESSHVRITTIMCSHQVISPSYPK